MLLPVVNPHQNYFKDFLRRLAWSIDWVKHVLGSFSKIFSRLVGAILFYNALSIKIVKLFTPKNSFIFLLFFNKIFLYCFAEVLKLHLLILKSIVFEFLELLSNLFFVEVLASNEKQGAVIKLFLLSAVRVSFNLILW